MKQRLGWFLWLMISVVCPAAEIVAWKVPVSCFARDGLESEGFARCQSAPETSPFFKEGDELWRVGKMPLDHRTNQNLPSDWLIWNASSGRLVAKGDWEQISGIHDFLRVDQLPRHCRLHVSLFPVTNVSLPFSKDSKPIAEVQWLSRSGQKSEASWCGEGNSISVEGEPTCDESDTWIDLRLLCSAKPTDQAAIEVNTALPLRSGESVWVARDFDGKQGLDLVVSGVIESLDCTPISERVMIQNGGQAESLILGANRRGMKPIRVGESGWFAHNWISPDGILNCISPDHTGTDPFAETPPKKRPLPKTSRIKPPPFLEPWLHHEVLDARKWFETVGLRAEYADDFVGYDPITESLFVYSSDKEFLERSQQLFMFFDGMGPSQMIISLSGVGQTRLIAKSGQKAAISRTVGDEKIRHLAIEPTLGENEDMVDLRMIIDAKSDSTKATHFNTTMILHVGEWLEIAAGKLGDGVKTSLSVKAEILRPRP